MKEFYYQIKGKSDVGEYGNWAWPPIFSGKVEAEDKKAAKLLIEEDYGREFPLRVLVKDLDSNEFLLHIKEIKEDDHHTKRLFDVKTCKQCGNQFKMIEKYIINNPGGGYGFCRRECLKEHDLVNAYTSSVEGYSPPVIYKITNKATGMCYIGKTRQVFTLRWYQHFFQSCGTKFHKAIRESKITDWIFEVIEAVNVPEELKSMEEIDRFIESREKEYILSFNSIENGYNTVGPQQSPQNELF